MGFSALPHGISPCSFVSNHLWPHSLCTSAKLYPILWTHCIWDDVLAYDFVFLQYPIAILLLWWISHVQRSLHFSLLSHLPFPQRKVHFVMPPQHSSLHTPLWWHLSQGNVNICLPPLSCEPPKGKSRYLISVPVQHPEQCVAHSRLCTIWWTAK